MIFNYCYLNEFVSCFSWNNRALHGFGLYCQNDIIHVTLRMLILASQCYTKEIIVARALLEDELRVEGHACIAQLADFTYL